MTEDKKAICELLCKTLQATRNGADIISIQYTDDYTSGEEYAVITFKNGYAKQICVTADSGTAMILDIVRGV